MKLIKPWGLNQGFMVLLMALLEYVLTKPKDARCNGDYA